MNKTENKVYIPVEEPLISSANHFRWYETTPSSLRLKNEISKLEKNGHHIVQKEELKEFFRLEIQPAGYENYLLTFSCAAGFPSRTPELQIKKSGVEEVNFKSEVLRYWNDRCTLAMVVKEFVVSKRRFSFGWVLNLFGYGLRYFFKPVSLGIMIVALFLFLLVAYISAIVNEHTPSQLRITTDIELTRNVSIGDLTVGASNISNLNNADSRAKNQPTRTAIGQELNQAKIQQATVIARATQVGLEMLTNSAKLLDYTVQTNDLKRATPTPPPNQGLPPVQQEVAPSTPAPVQTTVATIEPNIESTTVATTEPVATTVASTTPAPTRVVTMPPASPTGKLATTTVAPKTTTALTATKKP
ncbi:hypothetical protein [Candidatus Chlorohelix sp.]|uniref:hypothetical protein n=1 Tax=Candidatus Chlorohelix sp. TaxID=3139201 RepID=UPI003028E17C